jgi:diguanylate cyclase (GGDEF)-like protein
MSPHRFRLKLLLAALLPSVLLAVLLSYLWMTWSQRSLEIALHQRLDALSGQLATASEFHIFTGDSVALYSLTSETLGRDPDLVAVAIANGQGSLLARSALPGAGAQDGDVPVWPTRNEVRQSRIVKQITTFSPRADDPFLQISSAAHTSNAVIGEVSLVVSLNNLYLQRNRQLTLGFAVILLALVAAGSLAVFLANGIIRPVARIMAMVDRIGAGERTARLDPDPGSVLYSLEVGINRMAEKVALTQAELQARVDAATHALMAQKDQAELQARIDPLTGLHNRRALLERAQLEMQRAHRYDSPLCLILMDLDFFKKINDVHGHAAGDRVLIEVAYVLRQSIRDVDFVARLGGEEFVVLMPDTDIEAARQAAERMRQTIAVMQVEHETGASLCTASFGISGFQGGEADIGALMAEADRALYAAKAAGRDQVCVSGACR